MVATNPKKGLARVNERIDTELAKAVNLGAPALADVDFYLADSAMAVGSYTLLADEMADGSARNVTVTATQAGGSDDTAGSVLITGTNVDGDEITEAIIPVNGSTVAGTKAFASVESAVHSGWVAGGTADRIQIGFGAKVGMPADAWDVPGAAADIIFAILGGVAVAATYTWDADEPEKNTVDASAGTYNGTKRLTVLVHTG